MSSIKPDKGETLGSLMSEKFKDAGIELPVTLDGVQSDSYSATVAYVPGWSAQLLEGATPQDRSNNFISAACTGLHDLSLPSILALGNRSYNLTQKNNRFAISSIPADPVGLRRGDALVTGRGGENPYSQLGGKSDHGLGEDITTALGEAATAGYGELSDELAGDLNFETLSGGVEAGTLGSFFKADQLQEILVKDGGVESEAAEGPADGHDLLRKGVRSGPVPAHVQTVLDDTNRFSPTKPDNEGGSDESQSPYLKGAKASVPWSQNAAASAVSGFEALLLHKGLWSVQTGQGVLGKFDPDAPGVDVGKLKTIALQSLLAVGGHRDLAKGGGVGKVSRAAASELSTIAALVPSLTQIGAARMSIITTRMRTQDGALDIASDNSSQVNSEMSAGAEAAKRLSVSMGNDHFMNPNAGDVTMGFGPSSRNDYTSDPEFGSTYGSMNSFIEPFDGPFPVGMFFISLYGLLATALIGGLVEGLAGTGDGSKRPYVPSSPSSLAMGTTSGKGEDIFDMFMILFGFPRSLSTNFARCLTLGLMAFYGFPFPPQSITLEKVFKVALDLSLAPGYYATITKQVLRDFEQIGKSMQNFGDASGLLILTQIFKVVEALVSSTTFKFVLTLIRIGDIMYKSNYMRGPAGAPIDTTQSSERALKTITGQQRHALGRFYVPGGGAVSPLSISKHPSALFLPRSAWNKPTGGRLRGEEESLAAKMGAPMPETLEAEDGLLATSEPFSWIDTPETQFDRISQKTVRMVESALDTEYVPFYFHDLRTNEILALPAFITSFNEDYSVEWSSTDGYGRTDPVRIYNKTERTISMTFKLVAMNKIDHDFLWYSVNKLVSMCYPQKSMGRLRTYGDGTDKFIQPFSQVPTASPVIRIRLGELFHTNYSAVNLAAMFGHPGVFSKGQGEDNKIQTIRDSMKKRKGLHYVTADMAQFQENYKELCKFNYIDKVVLPLGLPCATSQQIPNWGPDGASTDEPNPFQAAQSPDIPSVSFITKMYASGEIIGYSYDPSLLSTPTAEDVQQGNINIYAELEIDRGESTLEALGGPELKKSLTDDGDTAPPAKFRARIPMSAVLAHANIMIGDTKIIKDEAKDKLNTHIPDATAATNVPEATSQEFFDGANNAIVRSFESTLGKGLAGVITTMGLNYDGALWATSAETLNARAPKSVEITLSFAPIHDLPLGLDYRGRLSAPSHPVGDMLHIDPYAQYEDFRPPRKGSLTADEAVLNQQLAGVNAAKVDEAVADASDGTDKKDIGPPDPLSAMMGSMPVSLPSVPGLDLGSIMDGGGLPFP